MKKKFIKYGMGMQVSYIVWVPGKGVKRFMENLGKK